MNPHWHAFVIWLVFTLAGIFAIVYKAAMTAGSEQHPFTTFIGYFDAKPLTVSFRFILGQLAYFVIVKNPHALGGFFFSGSVFEQITVGPVVLAIACGLASDKLSDVVMVICTWAFNKITGYFSSDKK